MSRAWFADFLACAARIVVRSACIMLLPYAAWDAHEGSFCQALKLLLLWVPVLDVVW
jgi:hypothetical protein